ncbi:acyl transferase/acyl hydrolase/lysophospholipase [Syncephalis pseudoplumigaleata]|uniref:Acyl transferase/acyl hydrolase/lysophospholipase n=1 Tax=Syncephalis pseudoplumigaleata TaxID=1712513 RepID=A0A4P9Z1K3_9FUNG|nr:acyl transferase/acyl hydrolase/lysophospholipase [Syncephalis pseudoplumigaleata]|eukprot:RKP25290.1 acyl transferase/acyl hydrolase/lysophospholipase [Syncephalis pseudoplumigaleata]
MPSIGLIRNLAGLNEQALFGRAFTGTKELIEDYTRTVTELLAMIGTADEQQMTYQQKAEFFRDTRQCFGRTALVLHGGSTFGACHLGVMKTLNEHGLLPRVICGSAVGALMASLICIHTDDELPDIFLPGGINLEAFMRVGSKGSVRRKLARFLKQGYLMDVQILENCVRSNVGDMTFEEAYARTKRILNITVSSTRRLHVPQLLNHLTAPNVLIWSAACASASMMGIYKSADLLAKDVHGNIVPWTPTSIKWGDANPSDNQASLLARMTELFNINHFIVSQANPLIVPFISKGPGHGSESISIKLRNLLGSELKHRIRQMGQMHLLPKPITNMFAERVSGNVTISPRLNLRDFKMLLSNPTNSLVKYWIVKGEQSTWPMLPLISNRCSIELALDRVVVHALIRMMLVELILLKERREEQLMLTEPNGATSKGPDKTKRTRSIH